MVNPSAATDSSSATAERCGRVGRPRSESAHQAILDAALDGLVEDGYAGTTIEGISARAKVGKATIYRRWPTKAELIVDALRSHVCPDLPVTDSGDVRTDLQRVLQATLETMTGMDGRLMAAFASEKVRHPELQDEFDRVFVSERRAKVHSLVANAVASGQLPADTDVELVAEVGFAVLWHHVTFRHELTPDLPARIVRQFLG